MWVSPSHLKTWRNQMKIKNCIIDILNGLERLWNVMKPCRIQYKLLSPSAKAPTRAYINDGGFDIYAEHDMVIQPRTSTNIRCAVAVMVPDGFKYYVRGRSSLNRLRIKVSTGLIDSYFNNELYALIDSLSDEPYTIKKGDKIAQISIHYNPSLRWEEVEQFDFPENSRGKNGFGSSGR